MIEIKIVLYGFKDNICNLTLGNSLISDEINNDVTEENIHKIFSTLKKEIKLFIHSDKEKER